MTVLLDGKKYSAKVKDNLKQEVTRLKEVGLQPCLVVILVGEDPASQVYVRNKKKAAEFIGIKTIDHTLPKTTTQQQVLELVEKYNQDPNVHGILVQLPLPKHISEEKVTRAISPLKDVDGFHPLNMGHLFMNEPYSLPCTPRGIMELMKEYKINVVGKNVVIVGRSNIVGRPMAALMLNDDATVTITHSKTKNLKEITKQADILIVAIGKALLITADYVKKGAVVIDVGMNRLASGKLVGDVDFDAVKEVADYITPVPGGVGPMTIAMLMKQTVEFAKESVK